MLSFKYLSQLSLVILLFASDAVWAGEALLCRRLFQNETASLNRPEIKNDLVAKNESTYSAVKQILQSSPQTIVEALNKDHLTPEKLQQEGFPLLSGVTRPWKYTTQAGETFLIKSGHDAHLEVVAYQIAHQVIPGRVPPSVVYTMNNNVYSVQRWMPWAEVSRLENGSIHKYENVAKLIEWQLPGEVVLFDLLIGNMDRARAKGHNYSIYTPEVTMSPDPAKALTVIFDHKDGFGSWKLERVWEYSGLAIPLRNENYIRKMVNENPQFVQRLEAMSEAWLKENLRSVLNPMRLEALIQRRAELLNLVDRK